MEQNVFVVEFRHTIGTLFDENKEKLSFLDELKCFREVVDQI